MAENGVVLRMPKTKADDQGDFDEWRRKPLMEKFRDHYHGKSIDVPDLTRFVFHVTAFWFLYSVFTELYVFLEYVIPWYFELYTPTSQLVTRILSVFVFLQLLVNSYYVRYTDSSTAVGLYAKGGGENGAIVGDAREMKRSEDHALNGHQKRTTAWCDVCCGFIPPRAHHCKICKRCILKRDHHCFMTGVCVGFWNQRFFIMMNFYGVIASLAALICIFPYVRHHTPAHYTWTTFLLPVTFIKWLLGSVETHMMFMICHLNTAWWCAVMCVRFVTMQARCIQLGLTPHEYQKLYPRMRCTATLLDRIRSVFGMYWLVNFLFPAHRLFPQGGDGREWSSLVMQ